MNMLRLLADLDPEAFEKSGAEAQARLDAKKQPRSRYQRARDLGLSRTEAGILAVPLGVWFGLLGVSLALAFLPIGR